MFLLLVIGVIVLVTVATLTYYYGYWSWPDFSAPAPSKGVAAIQRSAAEAEDAIRGLAASTLEAMSDAAVRRRTS